MAYSNHKSYGEAIAEGNYSNIIKWSKLGYCPIPVTTETDIWSYGATTAVVPLIVTADTMRVATQNAADSGVTATLYGPLTSDTSADPLTILYDSSVDFTTPTSVAIGDIVILTKSGTTPEWSYVTAVGASGAHTVTCGGGFSNGGNTTTKEYYIIDQSHGTATGALAVYIGGLDANYAQQSEIVLTNGINVAAVAYTATVKSWYRINEFRVIAVGSTLKSSSFIALCDKTTAGLYYTYITAGYNRARNQQYTVAAGKTLWITQWDSGFGFVDATKTQNHYCRLYTRANQYSSADNGINFRTVESSGVNVWYPYSEVLLSGGTQSIVFDEPTKLLQKVTLKVSGISSVAGFVTSVLRGYITTP
jgi:hypothetical protein